MSNRQKDKQAEEEIRVFKAFCNVCKLPITSFRNRKPPEPDIICKIRQNGLLAFELTEIVDRGLKKNLSKQIDSQKILYDYHSNLSMDQKEQFDKLYKNAMISPFFYDHEKSTQEKRKSILPQVFKHLLSLDAAFEGITLQNTDKYKDILRHIKITRGSFGRPLFDSPSATLFGNPTLPSIAIKFQKNYTSQHPIHLLAYFDLVWVPEEIWLQEVEDFCEKMVGLSPFEKIWIFDYQHGQIVFEKPCH